MTERTPEKLDATQPEEPALLDPERLRPYLSTALLSLLAATPQTEWAVQFTPHLQHLLRTVVTYLPRHIALAQLVTPASTVQHVKGEFIYGTLLFADISGFTDLSEKLRQKGGKEGAEQIVKIINRVLDALLAILFQHNGRLIKFGGDALLCLFAGNQASALSAVMAGWQMKQTMAGQFSTITLFQEQFLLDIKVGTSSGPLFAATVGSPHHMEYFLTGRTVETTARAESAATSGELIISSTTLAQTRSQLAVSELPHAPGFYRVEKINTPSVPVTALTWSQIEQALATIPPHIPSLIKRLDALTPYLPFGILPQLVQNPDETDMIGQHRRVTVLFANVTGLSQIIDACGPDGATAVGHIIQTYFLAMQQEIHYYGGIVNKIDLYDQGDKLVVLFGAPTAYEDSARRAVLAALAMQEAMNHLPIPAGVPPLIQRIGIYTGFVFAGNVGSQATHRREYTVMGDTVNLAARFMSAAQPDQIWISQEIWQQVQDEFLIEPLAPVSMKGISRPLPIYHLKERRDTPVTKAPAHHFHSAIVGRENELMRLMALSEDLLLGAGKLVVAIHGENGVGKSRLVAEWHHRVSQNPVTWVTAQAQAYGQRSHGVFAVILESLVGIQATDKPPERWAKLTAYLVTLTGIEAKDPSFPHKLAYLARLLGLDFALHPAAAHHIAQIDAEALQIQTRLAVREGLTFAAQANPLFLVLDDLHWADQSSLDMLTYLVDQIADEVPIFFCLLFRAHKQFAIWETWQSIRRLYPECEALPLSELASSNSQQLIHNLLQTSQPLPAELMTRIQQETDGNPLYIEETLHVLIENGALVQEADGWKLTTSIDRLRVPDNLYQIIQSRIDALDKHSPGARRLLWLASILGTVFVMDDLRHLFTQSGSDSQLFRQHLRALANLALIERTQIETENGRQIGYQFRHGFVQQVAYENMPLTNRRTYHQMVAAWLVTSHQDNLPPHYIALAHHFDRAQDWDNAVRYHRLAGEDLQKIYANQDALKQLQRVVDIHNEQFSLPAERLWPVLERLGRLLTVTGEYATALDYLQQARSLLADSAPANEPEVKARLCQATGAVNVRQGLLQEALRWQRQGLSYLPPSETAVHAQLYNLGAEIGFHQPNPELLQDQAKKALVIAQRTGALAEAAQANNLLGQYYHLIHQWDAAARSFHTSAAKFKELGNPIASAKLRMNLGVVLFEEGQWAQAQQAYQDSIIELEKAGQLFTLAMSYGNIADVQRHLGDVEQAWIYAKKSYRLFTRQGALTGIIFALTVLAAIEWRRGNWSKALAALHEARQLSERNQVFLFQTAIGRWLAQVYLAKGDLTLAEKELDSLLQQSDETELKTERVYQLKGQLLARQGKIQEGLSLLADILADNDSHTDLYNKGLTHLTMAEIMGEANLDQVQTRQHILEAHTIFIKLGAKIESGQAKELLARLQ